MDGVAVQNNNPSETLMRSLIITPNPYCLTQDEVEAVQRVKKPGTIHDMEEALAAKTQAVAELSRELEEIRAAFGAEGVQQVNVSFCSFVVWSFFYFFLNFSFMSIFLYKIFSYTIKRIHITFAFTTKIVYSLSTFIVVGVIVKAILF